MELSALAFFVEAATPSAAAAHEGEQPHALRAYVKLIRGSVRFVLEHRLVRWFMLFFAVITGSGMWLLWLYQPYMEWTGVPSAWRSRGSTSSRRSRATSRIVSTRGWERHGRSLAWR